MKGYYKLRDVIFNRKCGAISGIFMFNSKSSRGHEIRKYINAMVKLARRNVPIVPEASLPP